MNQTKKRLQIINIAISITDIETIQLQMLKLASLKTDTKLKEILAGLQAQNYAQTQTLITQYIETPLEEIIQRTSQNDQEVIEAFDLFVTAPESPREKETELFDFDAFVSEKPPVEEQKKEEKTPTDFDNLLKLTADEVMPDNIDLTLGETAKDDFFRTAPQRAEKSTQTFNTETIPKDTFFDTPPPQPSPSASESAALEKGWEELLQVVPKEEKTIPETVTETEAVPQVSIRQEEDALQQTEKTDETEPPQNKKTPVREEKEDKSTYQPIPYIDQKLKNMLTQYPPLQKAGTSYDSVHTLLLKISREGYGEKEIEEIIGYIGKLKERGETAEAAQLLLICGATQSKYAQFMLARELFKGELLEKNLPEAFTLIHRLAMDDDYPEALCDLAQFYENGIGITKDRSKAEALYQTSMELGIKRAAAHYERLRSAHKGLFGKLFKR